MLFLCSSGLLEDLSQPKTKAKSAKNPDNVAKTAGKGTARRGVMASSSDEDEEHAAPVPAAKKGTNLSNLWSLLQTSLMRAAQDIHEQGNRRCCCKRPSMILVLNRTT